MKFVRVPKILKERHCVRMVLPDYVMIQLGTPVTQQAQQPQSRIQVPGLEFTITINGKTHPVPENTIARVNHVFTYTLHGLARAPHCVQEKTGVQGEMP